MGRHTQYIISLEKSVIKGRCHLLRQKNLPFKFAKIPFKYKDLNAYD